MPMNTSRNADLEMDSQIAIHRLTRQQTADMVNLAEQFSSMLNHHAITVTDVRYAVCAVVAATRTDEWRIVV